MLDKICHQTKNPNHQTLHLNPLDEASRILGRSITNTLALFLEIAFGFFFLNFYLQTNRHVWFKKICS